MKTAFITFRDYHNKKEIGSSRIRADWVLKYWPGAELYVPGKKYDVEIFQKVYWDGHMKSSPAIKILDICDPDWVENPRVNEVIEYVDAITSPTEAFKNHFSQLTKKPIKVIPDRLDLSLYKGKKQHKGDAKNVVWFGYSHNSFVLKQALPTLRRLKMNLTVISDDLKLYVNTKEDASIVKFVKYQEKTANDDIMKHADIVLLPPPAPDDLGNIPYSHRFKSNNKTVNAWGLGLPVATNAEELEWFIPEQRRKDEAQEKWETVKAHYDVRQSVVEYLDLIKHITNG